jgi:hypothetical protein
MNVNPRYRGDHQRLDHRQWSATMVSSARSARILLAALVFAIWTIGTAAAAPPPTAVFPLEIYDTSGEPPQADRGDRLAIATRVLSEALEKTGRFSPIDLSPFSAEIASTSPRYRCGDCFLPVARKAQATYAVVSVVHKVSSLISSIDIWILDTTSGKGLAHINGQIRGDTPEAYAHGMRFLIRDRLPEEMPPESAPPK